MKLVCSLVVLFSGKDALMDWKREGVELELELELELALVLEEDLCK